MQACAEFLDLAQVQEKKWNRSLQYERHQRINLEETVEALARQHNNLERAVQRQGGGPPTAPDNNHDSEDEDDHEFFDAISEHSDSDYTRGSQDSLTTSASSSSLSSGRDSETKSLLSSKDQTNSSNSSLSSTNTMPSTIPKTTPNTTPNTTPVNTVTAILPAGSFGFKPPLASYVSHCNNRPVSSSSLHKLNLN